MLAMIFTVTLRWWCLPLGLFLLPIPYWLFFDRASSNWWGAFDNVTGILFTFSCWLLAAGLLIGHFLS
jgi:hypothetical protein